nr:unnamed protein product [Digitaria exilis]
MEADDLSALLPDELLADVLLRRLAPRDLAVSRSVCQAWRAVVDGHCTLRAEAELLPLSLDGLLIKNNWSYTITEFFARPSIPGGRRDFMAEGEIGSWSTVLDHCNGLLLGCDYDEDDDDDLELYVLNPATRRRARLPPCPCPPLLVGVADAMEEARLAYDPAVSPHFQLFLLPYFLGLRGYGSGHELVDLAIEQSEWPPATYDLYVFSLGTTISMLSTGEDNSMCIAKLKSKEYQVIKRPTGIRKLYLGKSKKGIYCASFPEASRLQVWILNESSSPMEWELKHDRDIRQFLMKNKLGKPWHNHDEKVRGPWILQDINYNHNKNVKMKALVGKKFTWNSDASDDDETVSKY